MEQEKWENWGWHLTEGCFTQKFVFEDFQEALLFIQQVGVLSESLAHHPKITNIYNEVELSLWTHDSDSITAKDFQWIKAFQQIRKA